MKTTLKKATKQMDKEGLKRKRFEDWTNTKWVMNNLDENQLALMDATEFDVAKYVDWFNHLVEHGIDIKLGWDNYSYCFQATLQGSYHNYPNCGYACSARSSEGFEDCIKILWFKFEYLCDGDMAQAYVDPPKGKRRG